MKEEISGMDYPRYHRADVAIISFVAVAQW
jgi:hypothetical protein